MTTEEITESQLRERHDEEAKLMGWKASYAGGQVPGDICASILPWPPELVDEGAKARYYLYRRNPLTGCFKLVQKS